MDKSLLPPKLGRKPKYDFTELTEEGEYIQFTPSVGNCFTPQQVRTIGSAVNQYRRKYKPKNKYSIRSIGDRLGHPAEVRVYLIHVEE